MNKRKLEDISLELRQDIFKMACRANGGHIAPAFSIVDILSVLYFDDVLRYKADDPNWKDRDYFVLSKGHGVLAVYAALCKAGFFDKTILNEFCIPGGRIGSLSLKNAVPGIEASTGSLGHGLSYAIGIALAQKIDGNRGNVYVLVGDGECQEGSIWEGFISAVHHKLDNLVIIIDNNKLQAMDSIETIMSFTNFSEKLCSLGLDATDINGHDFEEIKKALINRKDGIPQVVVAHTIKGKGISFMENIPIWHYRIPNDEEMELALRELQMKKEDLGDYEKSLFKYII